ncbi:hypothetical protein FRC00_002443 [Tulasnella sp. 408]|nr:hypothetical protein FRC00_002443 [Tulasnella sp. 408]
MPSDFLIRLGIVHQSPPTSDTVNAGKKRQHVSSLYILPDGMLHPQFETKRNARGAYVPCWKSAFELALKKGQLKRIHNTANLHPLLVDQISHQLRSRVLQELAILYKRFEGLRVHRRLQPSPNILRRLTALELAAFNTPSLSNSVSLETSGSQQPLAVIACPRKSPSEAVADDQLAMLPIQLDYPPAEPGLSAYELLSFNSAPSAEPSLPFYHGSRIFRTSAEQARLRLALDRIIDLDQQVSDGSQLQHSGQCGKPEDALDDSNDAYLLQSPANDATIDPVPLAISLWRLRLWEGDDWRMIDESANPLAL